MSKPKVRRVNYRINYCSSEDPEYPVSELVLQSADSKGWQSKRFATFPQTLVIELLELTKVNNISILSHQNKICTKIEIQSKEDHENGWGRLGYTTLESGVNTAYQSRELRNVNLGGRLVLLFRFTFHQNYANPINIFNQIGVIALLAYGEKASVQENRLRGPEGVVLAQLSDLDRETILKLKNLQELKQDAIDNNRFDEAKGYKEGIQRLQGNIKALMVLEKQKKDAIRREDYDEAKEITERMKRLRGPMVLMPRGIHSSNNNLSKMYDLTPKRKSVGSSMAQYGQENEEETSHNNNYKLSPGSSVDNPKRPFDVKVHPKRNYSMVIPHDQIKIMPKNRSPMDLYSGNLQEYPPRPPRRYVQNNISEEESSGQEHKTKKVEKLTQEQFDRCQRYFPIFNQITFEHLLSKQHQYREKGIKIAKDLMQKTSSQKSRASDQFVAASIFVVRQLIDDKIIPVLIETVDFFGMMMKKFRPGGGLASKNVKYILGKMADYLGHNNQKFRQVCQDVFASLPANGLTSRQMCLQVCSDLSKQKNPKINAGRLKMATRIMSKFGVANAGQGLLQYGIQHLEDKVSEVRMAAVELVAQISLNIGYENVHPIISVMRPQVIKMVQDKIREDGGIIEKQLVKGKGSPKNEKIVSNPQYYCDYCQTYDKRFEDDNFRDRHLFSSCPMIYLCKQCKQATQISNLNNHLLNECPNHLYFKKCPKCKEAIPSKEYPIHTKIKQCLTGKAPAMANRCPLCHEDIEPQQKGWIKHLAKEKCPCNPRN